MHSSIDISMRHGREAKRMKLSFDRLCKGYISAVEAILSAVLVPACYYASHLQFGFDGLGRRRASH